MPRWLESHPSDQWDNKRWKHDFGALEQIVSVKGTLMTRLDCLLVKSGSNFILWEVGLSIDVSGQRESGTYRLGCCLGRFALFHNEQYELFPQPYPMDDFHICPMKVVMTLDLISQITQHWPTITRGQEAC